ncbi:MAG TPA: MFS transporter [Rhizomicrobium sp.]|nr:MFS transporter [Rhizomicrobium sp.]
MRKQILSVGAILASVLILLVGSGLLGTVTPVRAHLSGFSQFAIGVIGSAYYVGFVAGCFAGPRLLARVGHSRTFAVAAALSAVTPLVQSLAFSEFWWIVARGAFGFAAASLYMTVESWLNDRATPETRGRIFAAYMTVNYLGLVLGQTLFMVGRPQSFSLFSLSAIFYALCLIPVSLTRLPQPKAVEVPTLRPRRMFAIAPVGVAGCIAVGLANAAVWSFAPVYAQDHHLTKGMLAAFMNAFTLAGAAIQMPLGRLSDRMDRRWIILFVSLSAIASGLALAAFGGRGAGWALALFALFGFANLPMYGLSVAHANDRLPREMFVESSATLLMLNAMAAAVGPVLASLVTTRMGIAWLFVYSAGIHVLFSCFVALRLLVKSAPPDELREPFEPMAEAGTAISIELDPRAAE